MNKLKWSLRAITICCTIMPLILTVAAYQGNLMGLIVPPQIDGLMSGNGQTMQQALPDLGNLSSVRPVFNNDFKFNAEDGTFSSSMNLTSPLNTPITLNSLSTTITDENGTTLCIVNLGEPVILTPGKNSTIQIGGTLSQELIAQLQEKGIDLTDPDLNPQKIGNSLDMDKIHFTNTNLDIGGIQAHIDDLNPEIFGSQKPEE